MNEKEKEAFEKMNARISTLERIIKDLCIEPKKPNDEINTYEQACEYLNIDDAFLMQGLSGKHRKAMIAIYKLCIIAEAWNKQDNFVPDYNDMNQPKWYCY
jgi:hypothetical protein